MNSNRPAGVRPRRRLPLWPLISLPVAGLVAGYHLPTERFRLEHFSGPLLAPQGTALIGALLGCGLMIAVASTVLACRIGRGRFTIGAMLFLIAVVAVLLLAARTILF